MSERGWLFERHSVEFVAPPAGYRVQESDDQQEWVDAVPYTPLSKRFIRFVPTLPRQADCRLSNLVLEGGRSKQYGPKGTGA